MQFIIVANDDLAPLGRQLAHALSLQKMHSGAFWTVKHYKDNEAQLDGKQPVIFLGDNEVAKSYVNVLPERFHSFGTKCLFEGAKAVLIAEDPGDVTREDLASLRNAVKETGKALSAKPQGGTAEWDKLFKDALPGPLLLVFSLEFGLIMYLVMYLVSKSWRKSEYKKLQHAYILARFLKDEFEAYVGGVEGR